MPSFSLHNANCLDHLRTLEDCSIHSIVTDPPYGISFMGKKWDYDVPSVDIWKECLRVLKPGGHLLAFAGTRTQHRMAVNIEDAGFELRDMIAWVYGQGFPKSHNIIKALDGQVCSCTGSALPYIHEENLPKKSQAERKVCPMRDSDVSKAINHSEGGGALLQPCLQKQSSPVNRAVSIEGEEGSRQSGVERRNNTVQEERQLHRGDLCSSAGMGFANGSERWLHHAAPPSDGADVRFSADAQRGSGPLGPQSEQQSSKQSGAVSQQWRSQEGGSWPVCCRCGKPMVSEGLGTALKPSLEPITLARKPFKGTVAANVLEHGTGAINVDGCRVEHTEECRMMAPSQANIESPSEKHRQAGRREAVLELKPGGRWPANLIHDGSDEVVGLFPEANSARIGNPNNPHRGVNHTATSYGQGDGKETHDYRDSGSAARFFYCPKVSKRERGEGNNHPTLKPIALMAYLCRLVTPPSGIVLDPFMGSGSTGIAALQEGFDFIGIEREAEYVEIAKSRIENALRQG